MKKLFLSLSAVLAALFAPSVAAGQTLTDLHAPRDARHGCTVDGVRHYVEYKSDARSFILYDQKGNAVRTLTGDDFTDASLYAATDLNGDGRFDLVYRDGDHQLTVSLQQPDGTFRRVAQTADPSGDAPVIADLDADGLTDVYHREGSRHSLLRQQSGDVWTNVSLPVTTDTLVTRSSGVGVSSAFGSPYQDGTIWGGATQPDAGYGVNDAFDALSVALDVNDDGYPDLIDTDAGGVMLSVGDGRVYPADFGGRVTVHDFNGDAAPDYLVYDPDADRVSVRLSSPAGYTERELLTNGQITGVHCGDLNLDGAPDVLLTLDYSGSYSYLVFLVGDGQGGFTTVERFFTDEYYFFGLHYLGDRWGVVANPTSYVGSNPSVLLTWDAAWNVTATELPASFINESYFADLDGDGVLEGVDAATGKVWRFDDIPLPAAPQAPGAPRLIADEANSRLRLEWTPAEADGTRTADFTYALRIERPDGTVISGGADADGRRYAFGDGNQGHNRTAWLHTGGWPAGTYRIAVQAVDPLGRGSQWSEPATYNLRSAALGLTLDRVTLSTGDTLHATLSDGAAEERAYAFDIDGGEVIACDGHTADIVFTTPGRHALTVTATGASGTSAARRDVEVTTYSPGTTDRNAMALTDFDADGRPEAYNSGIFVSDGRGTFTRHPSLFNADVYNMSGLPVDLDMDGLPDLWGQVSKNGTYYTRLLNAGGLNFSVASPDVFVDNGDGQFVRDEGLSGPYSTPDILFDLDNDGRADFCQRDNAGTYVYLNLGDNRFRRHALPSKYFDLMAASDYDRDGYVDLYGRDGDGVCVLRHRGDLTFERIALPAELDDTEVYFADLDGDGRLDACVRGYSERVMRFYYAAEDFRTAHSWPVEFLRPIFLDLDNDGRTELVDRGRNLYYPQADGTLRTEPYDATTLPHPFSSSQMGNTARPPYQADIDGDGRPDFEGTVLRSGVLNTPPTVPATVSAVTTDEGVRLNWTPSTDAESRSEALRYNVSLRRAGASGAGAYVLSPLTGGSAEAVPSEPYARYFREASSLLVPLARFEAGATYELSVQAVDPWGARSAFSDVFTFTVEASAAVRMPAEAGEGRTVAVTYDATLGTTPTWDWAGATATATATGWDVVWNEPGVKTVACTVGGKTYRRSIRIVAEPDIDLDLPWKVPAGSTFTFALPRVFQEKPECISLSVPDGLTLTMDERRATAAVTVAANTTATGYSIGVGYADELFHLGQKSGFQVGGHGVRPDIDLVTADAATGHNVVTWQIAIPESDKDLFDSVHIYKETSVAGQYALIGRALIGDGRFVDTQSDPTVRRSRYRLTLGTFVAAETQPGTPHASVHMMINRAAGGGYNLLWTPYEGRDVASYVLLRGSSPETLQPFATLSGQDMSFTDRTAGSGATYYALSYEPAASARARRSTAEDGGTSNVVCTTDAPEVTSVEAIVIQSVTGGSELSEALPALQLVAVVSPLHATFKQVKWSIAEGQSLASVNTEGLLTLLPNETGGTVVVRAEAVDGSGVAAVATFKAGRATAIATPSASGLRLLPDASGGVRVEGVTAPVALRVLTPDGRTVRLVRFEADGLLPAAFLPKGVAIVTAGGASLKLIR